MVVWVVCDMCTFVSGERRSSVECNRLGFLRRARSATRADQVSKNKKARRRHDSAWRQRTAQQRKRHSEGTVVPSRFPVLGSLALQSRSKLLSRPRRPTPDAARIDPWATEDHVGQQGDNSLDTLAWCLADVQGTLRQKCAGPTAAAGIICATQ